MSHTRKTLSVVMIVRDAAELLPDCLRSVAWADERIVLDSGSRDDTVAVAEQLGARVFHRNDWQGYGIQRQRAQQHASCDYVLMLDADERVTPELKQAILQVLEQPDDGCVYSVARRNWFVGRFMKYSGWYPDRVVRLYARERYGYNDNLVHESVDTGSAKVVPLEGDLLHLTCRDLMAFNRKQLDYADSWARQKQQAGRQASLGSAFGHALGCFVKMYLLRLGFLDGRHGLLLAVTASQYVFNKYAALWAAGQPQPSRPENE